MATPPYGFGAHDCGLLKACYFKQSLNACLKVFGFHVVGITTKPGILPGGVVRVFARCTPSPEFAEVQILNAYSSECFGEFTLIEVWKPFRTPSTESMVYTWVKPCGNGPLPSAAQASRLTITAGFAHC